MKSKLCAIRWVMNAVLYGVLLLLFARSALAMNEKNQFDILDPNVHKMILTYLPPKDICHVLGLNRASATLTQSAIDSNLLDTQYWKEKLIHEVGAGARIVALGPSQMTWKQSYALKNFYQRCLDQSSSLVRIYPELKTVLETKKQGKRIKKRGEQLATFQWFENHPASCQLTSCTIFTVGGGAITAGGLITDGYSNGNMAELSIGIVGVVGSCAAIVGIPLVKPLAMRIQIAWGCFTDGGTDYSEWAERYQEATEDLLRSTPFQQELEEQTGIRFSTLNTEERERLKQDLSQLAEIQVFRDAIELFQLNKRLTSLTDVRPEVLPEIRIDIQAE